jgi:hypothetical protein
VFVALIDTRRPPPEPEPEPEPPRGPNVPWRAILVSLGWLALIVGGAVIQGVAGLVLVLLAVVVPVRAYERSLGAYYSGGLKDHRQ